MYSRILVPLDGSELSERALPHALALARCAGSAVWLVRVMLPEALVIGPAGMGALYMDEILQRDGEQAAAYLGALQQRLEGAGFAARAEVISGPVAEALVDYARDHQADLIVMSTHGRSGLGRWVFGSVADRVLRAAHCPVLLVRAGLPAEPLPEAQGERALA